MQLQPQLLWAQVRLFCCLEQIKPRVNREERLIATVSTSQWRISLPRDTRHTKLIPPSSSLSPPLHIHCSLSLVLTRSVGPPRSDRTNEFVFVFFFFFLRPSWVILPPGPRSSITTSPLGHKLVSFPLSRTFCQSRWALPPSQFSAFWLLLWKT